MYFFLLIFHLENSQRSAALRGCNSKSRRPLAVGAKEEVRPRHHLHRLHRKRSLRRRPAARPVNPCVRTFSRILSTSVSRHRVKRFHTRTGSLFSLHSRHPIRAVHPIQETAKPIPAAATTTTTDPSPLYAAYESGVAAIILLATATPQSRCPLVQRVVIGAGQTTAGPAVL